MNSIFPKAIVYMIEEFYSIPWKCIFSTQVILELLDRAAKSSSNVIDTTEDACDEVISIWKAKDKCFSKLNIEGHVEYCWESCARFILPWRNANSEAWDEWRRIKIAKEHHEERVVYPCRITY